MRKILMLTASCLMAASFIGPAAFAQNAEAEAAAARASAAAAEARAAAASASAFCANAAGPMKLAAMRQLAVSINIFLIPSSLGPRRGPLNFYNYSYSIAFPPAAERVRHHGSSN